MMEMQADAARLLDRSLPTDKAARQLLRGRRLLVSRDDLLVPVDGPSTRIRLERAWDSVEKALEYTRAETNRILDLLAAYRRTPPDNWAGKPPPDWESLVETAEMGIAVTWVPRRTLLDAVLSAFTYELKTVVLYDNRNAVLDDCEAVVATVDLNELQDIRHAVEEATAAARAGYRSAAQSLASAAVSELLESTFKHRKLGTAKSRFESVRLNEVSLLKSRYLIGMKAAVVALEDHDLTRGRVPSRFNRHATAHRVSGIQYNFSSTLVSVLLASSLLKEASMLPGAEPEIDGESVL